MILYLFGVIIFCSVMLDVDLYACGLYNGNAGEGSLSAHDGTSEPTTRGDTIGLSLSCLSLIPEVVPAVDSEQVFCNHLRDNYSSVVGRRSSVYERYRSCRVAPILFRCECGRGWRVPNSCGVRTCPDCGEYFEARLVRRYAPVFRDLKRPDRERLVTLTAGHIPLTRDGLRSVYRQFQAVLGLYWDTYLCVLQVSAHGSVHCHALVYGDFVAQSELSDSARSVLGDGGRVVDIRRVGNVREAVRYVVRYAVRSPKFDTPKLRCDYYDATRGVRLVRSRGIAYGLEKKKPSFCCPDCGGVLHYEGVGNSEFGLSEWPFYSRSPVRPPDS